MSFVPAQAGAPISIAAADWNRVRAATREGLDGQPAQANASPSPVRLLNLTGADMPRFGAAGVGSPIIDAAASPSVHAGTIGFNGVATLLESHASPPRLLIAQQPIPAGRIGRASLDGVTHALIDGDANPLTVGLAADGDAFLTAGGAGYDVLWSAPGSGPRLATIRRSGGAAGAFGVLLSQTGGAAGDRLTRTSWTYDASTLDGLPIEQDLNPEEEFHLPLRPDVGSMIAATGGIATFSLDAEGVTRLRLLVINEQFEVEACELRDDP